MCRKTVFGQPLKEALIHQMVVKYLAGSRAGTKAQKTRSEVSGGGSKPWRQKGTGRARSGSTRSPIWRTGGKVFAARPRNYEQKLNKKMFNLGIRSILSELLRQDRLLISDSFIPTTPKTKEFYANIQIFNARRLVIVVEEITENLALASRNIPNVELLEAKNLNPVLLLAADKVVVTSGAVTRLEERLA